MQQNKPNKQRKGLTKHNKCIQGINQVLPSITGRFNFVVNKVKQSRFCAGFQKKKIK